MNKSIHTEYANLTPYNIKWLDECGATWCDSQDKFSYFAAFKEMVVFDEDKEFSQEHHEDIKRERPYYIHIPTGDEFCQGVAEILGIEYVQENPLTRKLINKLELHDKMERPLPEGTISKTVADDKGLVIDVNLLSEEYREWLTDPKLRSLFESYEYCTFGKNYDTPIFWDKSEMLFRNYHITTDPNEFMRYVADKTGKEWGERERHDTPEMEAQMKKTLSEVLGIRKAEENQLIDEANDKAEKKWEPKGDEFLENFEPNEEEINKGIENAIKQSDKEDWKIWNYPHKTYRVLDSLDGVPFDTRIPLSEWIPPIGIEVLFNQGGDFDRGHVQCIDKNGVIVKWRSICCIFDPDGHWMRIV